MVKEKTMAKKKNQLVFMDVSIDGDPAERMIFELFTDLAPKTAENFRALCTGEKGIGPETSRPLHYKGSFFHHIAKGSIVQGGDFVHRNGTGGESIYGSKFPDESPKRKHDEPGLLSMAIADRDTLGSHFLITLKADHHLDRKHVVFGKLVQGYDILKKIEDVGDEDGHPTVTVKIITCGEYSEERKKLNKLKIGKDASSEANSYEAWLREKHKKSRRDRRKRRKRYYSSESESSSDSELESSESDSDSDSYLSSSSYISSSSDDRRRKRKRSGKDKQRRAKRKDRKRAKKRRRRDRRSKRRSRRASDSSSSSDSESGTASSLDGDGIDIPVKEQKRKDWSQKNGDQSPLTIEKEVATIHKKKREEVDMLDKEEDSPKENGEQRSNGIGADSKSDRSEDRQPDVLDDHPGNSRSRSMSPTRTMSKTMSISPRRSESKSPSVSPERRLSRSPSRSRSPCAPVRRSFGRSPVRSISRSRSRSISGTPRRGRKERSVSRSLVKARSRRIESPVRSLSRRSPSPLRKSSQRSNSKSPARVPIKTVSRSPVRSSPRSLSRSSGRALSRRSNSRSPIRTTSRNIRRSYSRSLSPRVRSPPGRGRSFSRSVSPDVSPKRIRRGRGFSERYSYARRYRTPSRSPVRSYRYNGRSDRDSTRYSSYRRYSPRRYRSPPRGRTPRYRSRRSRTPSVSRSPRYRNRRYNRSRSPIRSRSPVEPSRSHASPSVSRSSMESKSPQRANEDRSRSSSRSSDGKKGLVSYGDGSPDSDGR
ncbi:Peptidyl-prolyl cis-trans isomerase [Quillaja saponaria]|uniref:peptidylprolyl isomerase n=1 Tax=Quillaja saponaria TaxID=32244 RepID=A0AAD7PK92_QUISA|nr:Peptidyl-prolyl cis-trans isomerase [Quillaja saponaria]